MFDKKRGDDLFDGEIRIVEKLVHLFSVREQFLSHQLRWQSFFFLNNLSRR
jgi:hypothetical protein